MSSSVSPTVVIVPGLRDHVEDHWQTLLAAGLDKVRTVPPLEHDKLSLDARVAALDAVLADIEGPVVLVAHSAGVMITVHWAARHDRPVAGAILATPSDLSTPLPAGYPALADLEANGWNPVPRNPLPFPSIVAASTNDPLADFAVVVDLAHAWGGRLVDLGEVGHLNPASGYGEWPRATELLDELFTTIGAAAAPSH
ncbi:RBBP9/YdeN family alpha/beta hydrolase [Prescottella agglutinans]|uniref:Alpha/beta hydrolase family esterase n=1 Tax=Prescottella agglutinans TaxID=1644129 RepID=A0ABT6M9P5_9NOCA|nr:alpha/beta fold hydrolase [Prescottella agglutinans]MDH6280960.1 putative alpha/beta hydrolase family esterase [Prescottella agglutinans]